MLLGVVVKERAWGFQYIEGYAGRLVDRRRKTGRWPRIRSQYDLHRAYLKAPGDRQRGTKKLQRAKAECAVWGSLVCLPQEMRGKYRKLKIRMSTMCILISRMGTGVGDRVLLFSRLEARISSV